MPGRLDFEEGAAADGGAEGDQQLGEDRDRVRFGAGRERLDDLAGEPVIGRWGWRLRPAGRGWELDRAGRTSRRWRLIEQVLADIQDGDGGVVVGGDGIAGNDRTTERHKPGMCVRSSLPGLAGW